MRHAACRLNPVITKRRNLDARLAASLNQQRPRGSRQLLSIDRERYVSHSSLVLKGHDFSRAEQTQE